MGQTATAFRATGVVILRRSDSAEYALHDECLEKLTAMSPSAFDPFTGGFTAIGPMFGPFTCAFGACEQHGELDR